MLANKGFSGCSATADQLANALEEALINGSFWVIGNKLECRVISARPKLLARVNAADVLPCGDGMTEHFRRRPTLRVPYGHTVYTQNECGGQPSRRHKAMRKARRNSLKHCAAVTIFDGGAQPIHTVSGS